MDIAITELIDQQARVTATGCLDAFHAPVLRTQLEALLIKGVKHIIFDLSQVTFMDSAGLAVLVHTLKYMQQTDGSVKLLFPQENTALRMLQLTRFEHIFERAEVLTK